MSKKYTVNQGFMSLSTYYLEDDRHLARLHRHRRRRRAYAPTSNTASHDNHEKILHGFPLVSYKGMGLRLAALRTAGAPLLVQLRAVDLRILIILLYLNVSEAIIAPECIYSMQKTSTKIFQFRNS